MAQLCDAGAGHEIFKRQAFMDHRLTGQKILVAVSPDTAERMRRRILEGHQVSVMRTVEEAAHELEAHEFALVVMCVTFDESRMFELLRLVRTFDCNRLTPVVCVLGAESRLSDVAVEGLDHAVKAMLANAFMNLQKFPDDGEGNARVRRIIDYLILIDGDMHGGFKSVHGDNVHR
jgi:PleD family two-component response regulator